MANDTGSKRREPSCVLEHDVMRRELRDKGLSHTECPECGWVLEPARQTVRPPSDRYMTRDSVVEELIARMDALIETGHYRFLDNEDSIRELFEAYRTNEDY
jgi:hypothetical protein